MAKTVFFSDKCKGCKLCITVCPRKIVAINYNVLNTKGFHPAGVTDTDKCTGCAFCAMICPDCAIEVEK